MITLHPNLLSKNGKNEFAVLPFEEFEYLKEVAGMYEDLIELRKAKAEENHLPTKNISEVKKMLNLE